jgi:putative membrane protein
MREYVEYLNTFARKANEGVDIVTPKYSDWKQIGNFLGISFAESNPRKQIKRSIKPLGNLPLEILGHIQGYLDVVVDNGTLKTPVFSSPVVQAIGTMNDALTGTERILNTPLPLAYRIVISQITWLYVLALPFQLVAKLKWTMIPAVLITSYIILSLALIGSHIENPFGNDVNDLPLDKFCDEIAQDIDIISSTPAAKPGDFVKRVLNRPLWPLSRSGAKVWAERDEAQIREALLMKVGIRHDRHRARSQKQAEKEKENIKVEVVEV